MTNQPDYRLYLEEKFKGLTTLVNAQFDGIHDRQDKTDKLLDLIHGEAQKTNSRVTHLEEQRDEYLKKRVSTDMLETVCNNIKEVKTTVECINHDLEEYRFIKKYPKAAAGLFLVFVAGFALSVISVIQNFKTNTKSDRIIEQTELVEEILK